LLVLSDTAQEVGMKRIAALAALILGVTSVILAPTALASTSSPARDTGVPRCPISINTVDAAIPGCMRSFTFNLPARASWATEVKGPHLLIFQEIVYRGVTYHVAAVHGDLFRLELKGHLFVNHGRALYHAEGYINDSGETRW
jgi:hypothetical protein